MRSHSIAFMGAGLLFTVVVGTGIIASQASFNFAAGVRGGIFSAQPQSVQVDSAQELSALFDQLGYQWPPASLEQVPPLLLQSLPPDIADITDVDTRKSLFLRSLLPIVMLENQRLREQRSMALLLLKNGLPPHDSDSYAWLQTIARHMKVQGDLSNPRVQNLLLRRLDEIPISLALAQAVLESGWGTSRFAVEGNSLFGQWTYLEDKGMTPGSRHEDANHLVRAFPDLQTSVRAYMHNLNTHTAYEEFRDLRETMRKRGRELEPYELAFQLFRYSSRGLDYVKEVQSMVNSQSLLAMRGFMPPYDPEQLAKLGADLDDLVDDPT